MDTLALWVHNIRGLQSRRMSFMQSSLLSALATDTLGDREDSAMSVTTQMHPEVAMSTPSASHGA